jgi:hypothetical protein
MSVCDQIDEVHEITIETYLFELWSQYERSRNEANMLHYWIIISIYDKMLLKL